MLHSKSLKGSMGNMALMGKKKHYLMFKKKIGTPNNKLSVWQCHGILPFLLVYILIEHFKKFIFSYQPFLHLLVEGLNIHIHLLLFSISKHSFCFGTYDQTRSWFFVAVSQSMINVLQQDFACTHTQISLSKIQL
jgi:hypothetical protein